MTGFTESVVEDAALAWLEALGYAVLHGPDIATDMPGTERRDQSERTSITLATLRDTLLPKLLSGELSTDNLQSL